MDLQDKLSAVVVAVAGDIKALLMALANKQDKLTSGTNIKTINGESVLGAGDLVIEGGGAGLTLFEESRSVAAPNATVPVHALTALGAETNIDFVIAPKGTGAILADVPAAGLFGGNKRGVQSVDLQMIRSGASQVASGNYSVTMGYGNTASGTSSVAMGSSCVASGNQSVAMGSSNTASGSSSVAMGGSNTASGTNSAAMGFSVFANGAFSVAVGRSTSTRGISSCFATGNAAALGVQQMVSYPLRMDTSKATATQLTVIGAAPVVDNTPVMPNNSAYYCRLRVLARNTTTNESMSWSGTALIKRGANAASTTLIGSSLTSDFGDAAMSACTVTLSADTTLGALAVAVTGLSSTSIRWVAQLETVEAA